MNTVTSTDICFGYGTCYHNFFGCGTYIDNITQNKLNFYVVNANCFSSLINIIYELFMCFLCIKSDHLRFTLGEHIFHARRSNVIYFVEAQMHAANITFLTFDMIENKYSMNDEQIKFDEFVLQVVDDILYLKGEQLIKDGIAGMKDGVVTIFNTGKAIASYLKHALVRR